MVKKKGKSAKKLKKKGESWQKEDVVVHSGLPPLVDGQLRCYLKLSVNQILWMIPNAPDLTHVRVQWWGEDGEGAVFRPVDVKKGIRIGKTTARYAIRSGPKQFAAYLNDMGTLVLEVLSGSMMVTVGRAQVDHLGLLAPNRPINGFFPVFSADGDKIAELQVSIVLESLMASYDSMSSAPTPDMSVETRGSLYDSQPINPPKVVPVPQPTVTISPRDDPFKSPTTQRKSSRRAVTPVGVDAEIFGYRTQDVPASTSQSLPTDSKDTTTSVSKGQTSTPRTSGETTDKADNEYSSEISTGRDLKSSVTGGRTVAAMDPSAARDLISHLLDKGTKLQQAMIKSTMDPMSTVSTMPSTGASIESNILDSPPIQRNGSYGNLFKEILDGDPVESGKSDTFFGDSEVSDVDGHAVDLILGPSITDKEFQSLKAFTGSPTSSISCGEEDYSDLGDPLHDEVILQELFYKDVESDGSDDISLSSEDEDTRGRTHSLSNQHSISMEEPGNMRPPSRHSSKSSLILECEPVQDGGPDSDKPSTPKKSTRLKAKGQRSRSGGYHSDSDARMSDSSRVSFDPCPSDAEEHNSTLKKDRDSSPDGLSVERLTLLGRVHFARVMLDRFLLSETYLAQIETPVKKKTKSRVKGKPPRPSAKLKKNSTYFIEYQFPVVATSRDKHVPNAMATEVMRVASKKYSDGVVSFGHRSVFPVLFDGSAVEKWWKSALVFKLFVKNQGQKVPSLLGSCTVPLKAVLKSEALYFEKVLDVKDRSKTTDKSAKGTRRGKDSDNNSVPIIGALQVCVELASDSKDFSMALAKTRLAEMRNPKIIPIPQPHHIPAQLAQGLPNSETGEAALLTAATQTEPRPTAIDDMPWVPPPGSTATQTLSHQRVNQATTESQFGIDGHTEAQTLHAILMIPAGQNITLQGVPSLRHSNQQPSQPPKPMSGWTGRDMAIRNLYLVCRMFWCDDVVRSSVCWGTFEPQFNFVQVAPVLITQSLLERLRNNYLIIEVWDKKTSSENDQLVGVVKLPLHQLYMSFRDRKISAALLRSQYPVVAVDNKLPIMSPFSGHQFGQLEVVLAMGSAEQVTALQRIKADKGSAFAVPERPVHYLERHHLAHDGHQHQDYTVKEHVVEHMFEVCVESIKGLQLFHDMIWGEADSFVQYYFPVQQHTRQAGGPDIRHATPTLKSYRTTTTLCVPDPTFNDVTRHKILLPEGSPVQRELLTACAGAGGGAGGVPFEVWCRYYYPNTRDQVISKAMLPLAKLCAMVTMQKRGQPSVQTFSLPLASVSTEAPQDDGQSDPRMQKSGLLEVTVHYKSHTIQAETDVNVHAVQRSLPGAQVCISVGVLRASGLKAAAMALSRHDAGMQYAAEVGVNSYARVKLSFLQKEDERLTRTVARTFAPEFSYHMDFPCPLLWTEPDSDALSLAEILETAEVTFELWHQVPSTTLDLERHYVHTGSSDVSGRRVVTDTGDVLLGTVTIPLLGLLTRKTGVTGWFPINLPSIGWDGPSKDPIDQSDVSHHGGRGLERVVGGLELSLKFAHHEDFNRVIHAARGVGWAPDYDIEHRDWDTADEDREGHHQVTVAVDFASFPVHNALMAGQTKLDQAARCYIRYKFYDRGAICSKLGEVEDNEEGYLTALFEHSKNLVIPTSSPFLWYLQEERLEVQVWVTYYMESEEKKRPRHRDKLIGSAYIDVTSLADLRRRQHRVSGIYPLFKPGASNMGGAFIRAHVSLKPHVGDITQMSDEEESERGRGRFKQDREKGQKATHNQRKITPSGRPAEDDFVVDMENTFPVHISIERAMHLPYVSDKDGGGTTVPNCYVSYQTAEKDQPATTNVYHGSDCPVWRYDQDTRLGKELLTQGPKNLVFKVWHKPGDPSQPPDRGTDRVLGFVSVDLGPLTSGLQQLCGWYNIMDFNGHCQGQIKVSITPQESLEGLKCVTADQNTQQQGPTTSFHTAGVYSFFPSHLSWYPEQKIQHAPGGSPILPANVAEHYQNVKRVHESMSQDQHQVVPPTGGNVEASKSLLLKNLRANLQELDSINFKLRQRLNEPTSEPSVTVLPASAAPSVSSARSNTHRDGRPPSGAGSVPSSTLSVSYNSFTQPSPMTTNSNTNSFEASTIDSLLPGISQMSVGQTVQSTKLHSQMEFSQGHADSRTFVSYESSPSQEYINSLSSTHMWNTYSADSLPWQPHEAADGPTSDLTQVSPLHEIGGGTVEKNQISEGEEEEEDGEGTCVIPKPLNDVSSANFANGLTGTFTVMGNNASAHELTEHDSWFGNTLNADASDDNIDLTEVSGHMEGSSFRVTRSLDHRPSEQDSWFSDPSHPSDRSLRQFEQLEEAAGHSNTESEEETKHAESTGEGGLLKTEDPTSLARVSRTSLSEQSKRSIQREGRKAARYRREFYRHRKESNSSDADSSSSEEEESAESTQTGSTMRGTRPEMLESAELFPKTRQHEFEVTTPGSKHSLGAGLSSGSIGTRSPVDFLGDLRSPVNSPPASQNSVGSSGHMGGDPMGEEQDDDGVPGSDRSSRGRRSRSESGSQASFATQEEVSEVPFQHRISPDTEEEEQNVKDSARSNSSMSDGAKSDHSSRADLQTQQMEIDEQEQEQTLTPEAFDGKQSEENQLVDRTKSVKSVTSEIEISPVRTESLGDQRWETFTGDHNLQTVESEIYSEQEAGDPVSCSSHQRAALSGSFTQLEFQEVEQSLSHQEEILLGRRSESDGPCSSYQEAQPEAEVQLLPGQKYEDQGEKEATGSGSSASGGSVGSVGSFDEAVATSSTAEKCGVPNFFLAPQNLAQSMWAIRRGTALFSSGNQESSLQDSQELETTSSRAGQGNSDRRQSSRSAKLGIGADQPQPTPQQSERIARIFSQRFSS